MSQQARVKSQLPKWAEFLFRPARYKIAYGGRGASKSWSFARALLIKAMHGPKRILCAREFQVSIRDSVHRLLSDQIDLMGLTDSFEVLGNEIKSAIGTPPRGRCGAYADQVHARSCRSRRRWRHLSRCREPRLHGFKRRRVCGSYCGLAPNGLLDNSNNSIA